MKYLIRFDPIAESFVKTVPPPEYMVGGVGLGSARNIQLATRFNKCQADLHFTEWRNTLGKTNTAWKLTIERVQI